MNPRGPLRAVDAMLALGLAVLGAGLFMWSAQTRMHGDASWMLVALAESGSGAFLHPLLYPVFRVVHGALGGEAAESAYLVSHLAGGVGLGASYLLARGLRATRVGAVLSTLLLMGTPALWFFATTIEVHALQFAVSALAGCCVLFAPWRRPWLAAILSLAVLVPVHASHQFSVLMGFGWPALIRVAHERSGRKLSWVRAYAIWGPLALGVLVATQIGIGWLRHGALSLDVGAETTILSQYHDSGRFLEMAWRGWIVCLGLLLPVALWGGLRTGRGGVCTASERWTPLIFWLLPVLFLLFVYPVPERGGFTLGSAPFLAVWAAHALGGVVLRGAMPVLALALVLGQLALGWSSVRAFDRGYDPDERLRIAREVLGGEGILFVGDHLAPVLHYFDPQLLEVDAVVGMRQAVEHGPDPRPELLEPLLRAHVGQRGLAIDLSYGTAPDRRAFILNDPTTEDRRWMDAFVAWVRAHYSTREHPDPWWPLLEIEGPR